MKNVFSVILIVSLMIFTGCSNSKGESVETSNGASSTNKEEVSTDSPNKENDDEKNVPSDESPNTNSNDNSSESNSTNAGGQEDNEPLSQYSSEQIEYARVWLQLGPNQEIEELNVLHIPAGTPINPDDETSDNYPENVIQLAGSRLVDGSVTYSGNGDGTINVYNVPLRWDGSYPAGENFYKDIIENTKLINVKKGDDEKIIALIKLLHDPSSTY
ncbi:hypothetical protein ABC255_16675 [Neobacillus sp. 3P2-tot-E-2]|uniref:hypothetical protein n=1 Tax=Neobacillus sp. 3P2-tot-E-2 TaxID=3132212 RepID=UPI00399F9489